MKKYILTASMLIAVTIFCRAQVTGSSPNTRSSTIPSQTDTLPKGYKKTNPSLNNKSDTSTTRTSSGAYNAMGNRSDSSRSITDSSKSITDSTNWNSSKKDSISNYNTSDTSRNPVNNPNWNNNDSTMNNTMGKNPSDSVTVKQKTKETTPEGIKTKTKVKTKEGKPKND